MADSTREAALNALKTALDGISGPTVQRNGMEPETVPTGGLVILRDGSPGPPVEETLSPHTYFYEHQAQVEVYVEAGTAAERDSALDVLLQGVADAVSADRTLGGVTDYARVREPQDLDEEAVDGGNDLKVAIVPVILYYQTTDPLK